MKITIFGSLNYDLVTSAERMPQPGETIGASNFETHHGGKGANQALAVRRLSSQAVSVEMIGAVGNDTFGNELLASMTKEGIDTSRVKVSKTERTGIASIFVDPKGENCIMVYPGANGTHTVEELNLDTFKGSDLLILQNEIPLPVVYKSLELAKKAGIKTMYNPSPVYADAPLDVFKNVDYLVVNSTEAQVLSKAAPIGSEDYSPEQALSALKPLQKTLGCNSIVITLGGSGSVYLDGEETGHVPAGKPERIVDTTGAGDTFLGAIAGQLIGSNKPLGEALAFASKASAIAVSRHGAAEGIPYLREIE
ncbi:ribokinase [Trichomonascus vanleenenianus]|uniref:putative ribokinase n=1 Tax=Trichomonascus vanleenenianus TaxID=2268995 RepID=UPI003ECA5689